MTHETIASEFDQWADAGRGDDMERGHGDVVEQVVEQLGIKAGEKILDLGCGTGWATRLLAKSAPGTQAVGIDVSPRMIAKAEEQHSFTIRARYEVGTFDAIDAADASFDRAFSMEALYYAPDVDAALAELFRVLKPGAPADIVIDFYSDREGVKCWQDHLSMPMQWRSEAEWRATFEAAGFEVEGTERVVDRRGPGDEASFEPSKWHPTWADKVATHEAGSLWIRARKPA